MLYIKLRDESVFKFELNDIESIKCSSNDGGWVLVTISHCVQDITVLSEYHFPFNSIIEYRFMD